ncbi:MAG TPA: ABC transporter permease [Acidimicrobiia bacterium]|nr:ABC transporter permease [Acidimicrobiia bacterium]
MYLAIRDLRAAAGRFMLVGLVVALVALLGVLLSGLASGLVDDGISGLRSQKLTHLIMQSGSGGVFSKSTVTPENLSNIKNLDSVEYSELGMSFFNSKSSKGTNVDLAVFGLDSRSFLIPREDGRDALAKPNTIVISQEIADSGLEVGDTLTLLGNEMTLTVAGVTQSGTYGHVPIAYTSLSTWQSALYGNDPRGRFSAVAIKADSAALSAIKESASQDGMQVVSKQAAYKGSPGYEAETSTMTLIRAFLFVISTLIVGAFFTVWTVQRTREIGIMKALGATNKYVVRDALSQLSIVITVATAIGSLFGYGIGQLVPNSVPFSLHLTSVLVASVGLIVVGLLGSVLTIRRIVRVDPLVALGSGS